MLRPQTMVTLLIAAPLIGGLASLVACVSHDYVGERYAPTEHVQVFYDGKTPAGFRSIGQDRAEATEYMSTEQIVQDMVAKAQEVGADAISIMGVDTVVVGNTTNTYGQDRDDHDYYATQDGKLHRRHKSSGAWRENSYTTVQKDKVVTAVFLKREG
tara:strand:+ start:534 stop:1004 length:471 start_codon:yes stop_codon:yes gene_type:complete